MIVVFCCCFIVFTQFDQFLLVKGSFVGGGGGKHTALSCLNKRHSVHLHPLCTSMLFPNAGAAVNPLCFRVFRTVRVRLCQNENFSEVILGH